MMMPQIRRSQRQPSWGQSTRGLHLVMGFLVAGALLNARVLWGGMNTRSAPDVYVLVAEANMKELSHLLSLAGVKGVSLSVEWRAVEPQEGRFQWNALDELVAKA